MSALRKISILLSVALFIAAPAANATNSWFAKRSAVVHMSDADRAILTEAMQSLLSNEPDGSFVEWSNPDTGSHGTLQVAGTHKDYGTTCRLLRMTNTAKQITRKGDFRLCKDDKGVWRFAPNQHSS